MESIDRLLSKSPEHLRASIAYLTRDAYGDIHGHTARPQIFDTHWLSEAGDGHYLGAYWGSALGWEDSLIQLDSAGQISTIPWEKNKEATMDFNQLIARCKPADRAGINYITVDAYGAVHGHTVRPYTFHQHWRSPEGDGIYICTTEPPAEWQSSIVARPTKLGALEAPIYAVSSAVLIVAMVWVYMSFIYDGKKNTEPSSETAIIASPASPVDGAVPAGAEVPAASGG